MANIDTFFRVVMYCDFQDKGLDEIFGRKITSIEFDPPFRQISSGVFESSMIARLREISALTDQICKFLGTPVPPGVKIYLERGRVESSGVPTVEQVKILESLKTWISAQADSTP